MDAQKWAAFLSDPELDNQKFPAPDGQYLLGNILHDALQFLHHADAGFKLLISENPELAQSNSKWIASQQQVIQSFIPALVDFWKYVKDLPPESDKWPYLLEEVGQKLGGTSELLNTIRTEVMTLEVKHKEVVSIIVSNLERLDTIVFDIQGEEYKKLLITMY